VAAVATFSATGFTTLSMARERPSRPILAITLDKVVARRLGLVWGVKPYVNSELFKDFGRLEEATLLGARQYKIGKKGDYLVITAGYPIGERGMTNLIHAVQI